MPEHPDTLARYCAADTAIKVLETQALRWRAPHLLGDPFELNHRTTLGFDPKSLLDHVIRAACGMIFAREEPRGSSPLATVIRRWRGEERFASPEEAEEVLEELMARMVDQRLAELDDLMSDWRQYTRQLRILPLGAKPDNLTCWQYRAACHTGAVLRFRVGEDTSFGTPEPMRYGVHRPEITTLKEQLNAVLYQERIEAQLYFQNKFLHKPQISKHEQEWRCFFSVTDETGSKQPDDQLWFNDRPFDIRELEAVYLGAKIDAQYKKSILEILAEDYPDTKLFQADIVPGRYDIQFSKVVLPKRG